MVHIIDIEVIPDESIRTLRCTFADDSTLELNCLPLIARGGVFAALKDWQEFIQFGIPQGRTITWMCGAELCADAVWQQSLDASPMLAEIFP